MEKEHFISIRAPIFMLDNGYKTCVMDKGNTIGVRLATFIMEHGRMIKNMGKER
jgi:hypothetical protein